MRINYLSAANLSSGEANSVHVMHMCAAFAELGHETTLFCRGPVDSEAAFNHHGIEGRFAVEGITGRRIYYTIKMLRRARTLPKPDLWFGRHVYPIAAVALRGAPFIFEQHGVHRRRAVRRLIRAVLSRQNLVAFVVISEELRRACLEAYPTVDPDKVIVAHDAASPFPIVAPCLPKKKGVLDVGYAGHLYAGKGMEVIVPLAARLPEARFHVIGGRDQDLARWKARGLPSNLILHGFVPHVSVPAYLASLDIALLPNQRRVALPGDAGDIGSWTSPLKMFEYMAAGLPIVASDLPTLREVLKPDLTALFAPPDDIDCWEIVLKRLLESDELRRSLGAAARADFLDHYTWTRRAQRVLSKASHSGDSLTVSYPGSRHDHHREADGFSKG